MNKGELISAVAEASGLSKIDSEKVFIAFVNSIADSLEAGEKVQLTGFGTFTVKSRTARKGLNPRTKEVIDIVASKIPSFKTGKTLKDAVSNGNCKYDSENNDS